MRVSREGKTNRRRGNYTIFYRPVENGIEVIRVLSHVRDIDPTYFLSWWYRTMRQQPASGQRVRIREGVEKYGGLSGQVIHRQWVTGSVVYHRESPPVRAEQGQLALVVALDDPPPDLEPVILCYEEHISRIPDE